VNEPEQTRHSAERELAAKRPGMLHESLPNQSMSANAGKDNGLKLKCMQRPGRETISADNQKMLSQRSPVDALGGARLGLVAAGQAARADRAALHGGIGACTDKEHASDPQSRRG
jgi:hypothetical protein